MVADASDRNTATCGTTRTSCGRQLQLRRADVHGAGAAEVSAVNRGKRLENSDTTSAMMSAARNRVTRLR